MLENALVRRTMTQAAAIPRDKKAFRQAVLRERPGERARPSRGMRRPRGVKRKMSGYKIRPRGRIGFTADI